MILDRWGIEVEHICAREKDGSKRTFESCFYKKREHSKNESSRDKIYGWPMLFSSWCNQGLKVKPYNSYFKKDDVHYLGIALDEPERLSRLSANKISPLEKIGWTEADCYKWCEENNLLSPIYSTEVREGCWFCPKQNIGPLRRLRRYYPELWDLMLKWDNDSPFAFKTDGRTVHDYDKRFELEDQGLLKETERCAWKKMKQIMEEENGNDAI